MTNVAFILSAIPEPPAVGSAEARRLIELLPDEFWTRLDAASDAAGTREAHEWARAWVRQRWISDRLLDSDVPRGTPGEPPGSLAQPVLSPSGVSSPLPGASDASSASQGTGQALPDDPSEAIPDDIPGEWEVFSGSVSDLLKRVFILTTAIRALPEHVAVTLPAILTASGEVEEAAEVVGAFFQTDDPRENGWVSDSGNP